MTTIEVIKRPKDKRFIDLAGKTFNHLTAIAYGGKWGNGKTKSHYWYCECSCGVFRMVTTSNLKSGNIKSCGCKSSTKIDRTGERFGRLIVLEEDILQSTKAKSGYWKCLCDCGEEITVSASNLVTGHTKSCGCLQREQTARVNFKNLVGKTFGRLKVIRRHGKKHPVKWLTLCECGEESIVAATHLQTGHTRSCGCLEEENRRLIIEMFANQPILRGKDHPSYKHEISDEDRIKNRTYYREELNEWRTKVFKRDDYTCVICGSRGVSLHAHHLDGYHWCVEGRFDVNNGVTLCEGCHYNFHQMYGRRDNTKEQFQEFLQHA